MELRKELYLRLNITLTGANELVFKLAGRPDGVTKSEELRAYEASGRAKTNSYVRDLNESRLIVKSEMTESRKETLNKRNKALDGSNKPFVGSLASSEQSSAQKYYARYVIRDCGEKRGNEPVFRLYDLKTKSFIVIDPATSQKEDGDGDNEALQQTVSSGAGFGNPEENKEVEKAAIAIVKKKYKFDGWTVRSVERDKCGYDLACHKGETTENIEVKGVRWSEQSFFITAGEVQQAQTNPKFVLFLVTSALTSPVLSSYSGPEFVRRFKLKCVQYRAAPRPDK